MRARLIGFGFIIGLFTAATATASPVTFTFAGTVGSAGLLPAVPDGTPATAAWTFDTAEVNQCGPGLGYGFYGNQHVTVSIFTSLGLLSYSITGFLVSDAHGAFGGPCAVGGFPGGPAVPGSMELRLTGTMNVITKPACDPAVSYCLGLLPDSSFNPSFPPGGMFWTQYLDGGLPVTPPDSVLFELGIFRSVTGASGEIRGTLNAVPEPGSFLLLGTGLAAVFARRRFKGAR